MKALTALLAGLIILIFAVPFSGCTGFQKNLTEPSQMQMADNNVQPSQTNETTLPDWMYTPMTDCVTGNDISTSSLISADKPLIIHTFAVWCPACTKQLQETTKLLKEEPGTYQFLAIDIDSREDRDRIISHIQKNKFTEGYYVSAPEEVLTGLIDTFGQRILFTMPQTVVICNKTVYLFRSGVAPSSLLKQNLERICS